MMISYGYQKHPLQMWSTRHYTPDYIYRVCIRQAKPYWFQGGDHVYHKIHNPRELYRACKEVAEYHNYIAYNVPEEDGFAADMEERELRIQAFLEEPDSDEDTCMNSDEDLLY